jgi:alpha-tubulin suppressor-like RCC1 family protein
MSNKIDISNKFKISRVACGGHHTLALTSSGDVLSWGYGNSGQLGLGNSRKCSTEPTLIYFGQDRKFVRVYAGYSHSMAIAKEIQEVYTWGDGSKGQLGRRVTECFEPAIVDELSGRDICKG